MTTRALLRGHPSRLLLNVANVALVALAACRSPSEVRPASELLSVADRESFSRVEEALARGDADGALSTLDAFVERRPDYFRARRARQDALLLAGRDDVARTEALRAVHTLGDAPTRTLLARLLPDAAAERQLQRAVRTDPTFHWAWYALAVIAARRADFEEAEDALDRALQLDPRFLEATRARAEVRERQADFEGAAADYRGYLDVRPTDADALYNFATILHRELRRPDAAEELYRFLLDLDGDRTEAAVGLAVCLTEAGDYAAAERIYLAVADQEPAALFNLGMLYQEHLGRDRDAWECFRKFIRFEPVEGGKSPAVADRWIYAPVRISELEQKLGIGPRPEPAEESE